MTLCFIRKSQPKITGVDKLSSTRKVCSACRFPRLTDSRDVPKGWVCLPSALTSSTPCMGCKLVKGMSLPEMTEQEAPESNRIGVRQLLIDPLTLATVGVCVFLLCARVGKYSVVRASRDGGYSLLGGSEHPLSRFPGSSSPWQNVLVLHN